MRRHRWRALFHYCIGINIAFEWAKSSSVASVSTFVNTTSLITSMMLGIAFSYIQLVHGFSGAQQCIERFGGNTTSWACSAPHCTSHFPKDADGRTLNPYYCACPARNWAYAYRVRDATAAVASLSASLIGSVLLSCTLWLLDDAGMWRLKMWWWIRWVVLLIFVSCITGVVYMLVVAGDFLVYIFPDFNIEQNGFNRGEGTNIRTWSNMIRVCSFGSAVCTLSLSSLGLAQKKYSIRQRYKMIHSRFPTVPNIMSWRSWTHRDVYLFFGGLEGDRWALLMSKRELFHEHQVAGMNLPLVTPVDLKAMGLTVVGERLQIVEDIKSILQVATLINDGYLDLEDVQKPFDTKGAREDEREETLDHAPSLVVVDHNALRQTPLPPELDPIAESREVASPTVGREADKESENEQDWSPRLENTPALQQFYALPPVTNKRVVVRAPGEEKETSRSPFEKKRSNKPKMINSEDDARRMKVVNSEGDELRMKDNRSSPARLSVTPPPAKTRLTKQPRHDEGNEALFTHNQSAQSQPASKGKGKQSKKRTTTFREQNTKIFKSSPTVKSVVARPQVTDAFFSQSV